MKTSDWRIRACILALLSQAVGCGATDPAVEGESTNSAQAPLVGGTIDDQVPYRYPMTGSVMNSIDEGIESCTATLLSCSVGITAAHCLCAGKRNKTGRAYSIGRAHVSFEAHAPIGHGLGDAIGYAIFDEAYGCGYDKASPSDLALFNLTDSNLSISSKLALQAASYATIAPSGSAQVGVQSIAVGYGEPFNMFDEERARRFGVMPIKSVLGMVNVDNNNDPHTIKGDSGGPLFLPGSAGSRQIVGIVSGSSDLIGQYVHVTEPTRRAWIEQAASDLIVDTDEDGIADRCDLCPRHSEASGPNDPDSDGDGTPDACDDCPCSASEKNPLHSSDGDSVCNTCDSSLKDAHGLAPGYCQNYCKTHPVDNCPTAQNSDQGNCNAEAEIANNAVPMGDKCDPVPCPHGTPIWKPEVVISTTSIPSTATDVGYVREKIEGSLDKFNVIKRLNSEARDTDAALLNSAAYRYCDPRFSTLVNCRNNANLKDNLLEVSEAEESQADPWHIVRATGNILTWNSPISAPGYSKDFSLAARDYRCKIPGGVKLYGADLPVCPVMYDAFWLHAKDFAKWQARYPSATLTIPVVSAASGGRFWFHVETGLGTTDTTYGAHKSLDGSPGHGLANHVEDMSPTYQYETVRATPILLTLPPFDLFGKLDHCPNCGEQVGAITRPPFASNPNQALLLARTVTRDGTFYGYLAPGGGVWVPAGQTTAFPASVTAALSATGVQWLASAEASSYVGSGSDNPVMVALSSSGTSLARKISLSSNGLSTTAYRPLLVPAPSRTGFSAVYSRAKGLVFVIGGTSRVPIAPIQAFRVSTGRWMKLPTTNYVPAKVAAATYSMSDDSVWTVELSVDLNLNRVARIMRIDLATGTAEKFGDFPHAGNYDKFWLSTDLDGHVVLTASSTALARHAVVELDPNAGVLEAGRIHVGSGALSVPATIDLGGMRLVSISGATISVNDFNPPALNTTVRISDYLR